MGDVKLDWGPDGWIVGNGESQVFVDKTTAKVSKMVDAEYKHLFGGFTDVN